jgi:hypothetical protein
MGRRTLPGAFCPGSWVPWGEVAEKGQGIIELALTLPFLLALASAILDGGYAFHEFGLVAAAAEAAQRRLAIVDTGSGHCQGAPPPGYADVAREAAATAAPHLRLDGLRISVWYVEPECDGRVRTLAVSVAYPLTVFTPWLAPVLAHRQVTGRAAGAVEEVAPAWWGQGDRVRAQEAQIVAQEQQIGALSQAVSYYYSQWQQTSAALASVSQTASYYYAQWQNALSWGNPWLQRGGPDNGPH